MKRISKTEIKEMRSQSKKNSIMFAFTLPTVILYTIFFLVTMLIGVYYSFTDWNGISKDYTFVGLKNYVKVLTDERFREALWFNIGYTIALVVLLIVIPLTIALALNRIRRLSTLFRSIYFIPAVISMVTVGLIWNTQCGMFAATKVLQRYGLKYSYIYNCTTKSEEFLKGYETFIRTAAVLKSLRTLRIAKIGERPVPFMSVMTNEANLIKRFGITTVPISPVEICNRARKILEEKGKEYIKYEEEFVRKFPDGENYQQICATKLAVQELMEENNCSVAAFECWSAFPTLMGLCPCVVLGEMADNGMPLSCETDINGAITLAILRACNLFEESEFLADLTIRHPQNDNAELLWHCGPFPYSLKKDGVEAKLVDGQERFELKQGDLTVCRFDDVDGEYYLFAGEAKTTTGPETNGTYVWMETDNWKRWEEKLMFGPYIHHLGCVYGHYLPVLREVSRYLGIHFDNAHEQGIYSL